MIGYKKFCFGFLLAAGFFFTGCSSSPINSGEPGEETVSVDVGGSTTSQIEEDMNAELVYDGEPELVNPRELFATIDKAGVLMPQEFYAKKGEYVLLKIMNNSKEEHAIVIPQYGWRTILHKGVETEFGFRARDVGVFPFHCSQYCTETEHHISGTVVVEA
jgi:nitrous oxide reductase